MRNFENATVGQTSATLYEEHKGLARDFDAARAQQPYEDTERRKQAAELMEAAHRKPRIIRELGNVFGIIDPNVEEAWRLKADATSNESAKLMDDIGNTRYLVSALGENLASAKAHVDEHLPEYIAEARQDAEAAGVSIDTGDK